MEQSIQQDALVAAPQETVKEVKPLQYGEMTRSKLRKECLNRGLSVTQDDDKYVLVARLQDADGQTTKFALRKSLARRGLPTEGSIEELDLRLEVANQKDSVVLQYHRHYYKAAAAFVVLLGVLALIVSLPHVANAIDSLMGCGFVFACILAITIDLGIVGLKFVDTLKHKFDIRKLLPLIWLMCGVCIVMSAALNYHGFAKETVSEVYAYAFALFLPIFAFAMSFIGSNMFVSCVENKPQEEFTNDDILTDAINTNQSMNQWISKAPVKNSN